jgi:hypothetical protein
MEQWALCSSDFEVPATVSNPHGDSERCCLTSGSFFLHSWQGNGLNSEQYSHLYRGVYPFLYPIPKPDFNSTNWQEDVDRRLSWGIQQGIKLGILRKGETVVCVQGWRGGMGHTNTVRIVPAEMDLGLLNY